MTRLQILELPEGVNDERAPFVLVIDQYEPEPYPDVPDRSQLEGLAEKIGARAVLVFDETIDIPANEPPTYSNGETFGTVRVRLEPDLTGWDDILARAIAQAREAVNDKLAVKIGDKETGGTVNETPRRYNYDAGGQLPHSPRASEE